MSEKKLRVRVLNPESLRGSVTTVYAAYRQCYMKNSVIDALDNDKFPSFEKQCEFIHEKAKSGHISPCEHMNFSIVVEGVARSTILQLIRHRVGVVPEFDPSASQQSQRYCGLVVEEDTGHMDLGYVLPKRIADDPECRALAEEHMKTTVQNYEKLVKRMAERYGVSEKTVYEDARCVLPEATETRIVLTCNYVSWMHLFEKRSCVRAQHAIRELIRTAENLFNEILPELFPRSIPCARRGYCTETKEFGCGAQPTLEEIMEENKKLKALLASFGEGKPVVS